MKQRCVSGAGEARSLTETGEVDPANFPPIKAALAIRARFSEAVPQEEAMRLLGEGTAVRATA